MVLHVICTCTANGTIVILGKDADGLLCELSNFKAPKPFFSSPVFFSNTVIVGCRDNNVYCFNIK